MKQTNLKARLIDDEQVFENLPGNEAGIMTSSGEGGCDGCGGCGGTANQSLSTSIHSSVGLNSYNWEASGNVNVYASVELIYASGEDKDYRMTASAACSISLQGHQSSSSNDNHGTSQIS